MNKKREVANCYVDVLGKMSKGSDLNPHELGKLFSCYHGDPTPKGVSNQTSYPT
jgi:hypothetical protein